MNNFSKKKKGVKIDTFFATIIFFFCFWRGYYQLFTTSTNCVTNKEHQNFIRILTIWTHIKARWKWWCVARTKIYAMTLTVFVLINHFCPSIIIIFENRESVTNFYVIFQFYRKFWWCIYSRNLWSPCVWKHRRCDIACRWHIVA